MDKPKKDASAKSKPKAAAKRPRKPTEKESTDTAAPPEEFGGPPGPEPTRYGDWQIKGRVSDF